MKRFEVFQHPTLGYEAVKVGFSWPGFFFGPFWAAIKQMWLPAAIIFLVVIALVTVESSLDQSGDNTAVMASLLQLGLAVFIGFQGNEWRRGSLRKRGYNSVSTVEATNPESAIATLTRGKDQSAGG